MSSPFYQQFSAKSPLLQAKKSQLERANALVRESQADVDASRATFGTNNVDEAFDRKLRVLKEEQTIVYDIKEEKAVQVNLSGYASGIYLIRYPVGKQWVSGKVVLMRN